MMIIQIPAVQMRHFFKAERQFAAFHKEPAEPAAVVSNDRTTIKFQNK